MAKKHSLHAELGELRSELSRAAAAAEAAVEKSGIPNDAEKLLHELQASLAKAGEEAEDLVAAHPLATVAAGFLLGLLAGRMLGRAR